MGKLQALGRPVLIGTRSVERSEMLSQRLKARGIDHQRIGLERH